MQNDFVPFIEPTPKFTKRWCRFLTWVIALSLTLTPFAAASVVWFVYDYFYAVAALISGYLLIGIVRSKIRNSAIPLEQQEYNYSDHAVAAWYVSRVLLCDFQSNT